MRDNYNNPGSRPLRTRREELVDELKEPVRRYKAFVGHVEKRADRTMKEGPGTHRPATGLATRKRFPLFLTATLATMLSHWKVCLRQVVLPTAGWAALACALALWILRASLTLPSGYGIEDFLAFTDPDAIKAARETWRRAQDGYLLQFGVAYLAADLMLFIPLYAVTALRVADWLDDHLRGVVSPVVLRLRRRHRLAALASLLTAVLVAADVLETSVGLAKLLRDGAGWLAVVPTAVGMGLLAALLRADARRGLDRRVLWCVMGGSILAMALVLPKIGAFGCDVVAPLSGLKGWAYSDGCAAHRLKLPLSAVLLALLAAGLLLWQTGVGAARQERRERFELLQAIGVIIVRTRYVLALLVVLAALLAFGHQTRDVLASLAVDGNVVNGMLVSAVALWTLSHSCWLWARVACRVPGPTTVAPYNRYVEGFAKYWARALALVPMVLFTWLSASVMHDLVAAQSDDGAGWMLVNAFVVLAIGLVFVWNRERIATHERARGSAERYFDDPTVVKPNGVFGQVTLTGRAWAGRRYRFWLGFPHAPVGLPLASLGAMVGVRYLDAVNVAGPWAFASLLYAFSAWIGFAGWLGHLERRQALPWGLALLGVMGLLGAMGWSDNHAVWSFAQQARPPSTVLMWCATAALALVMAAGGVWAVFHAPKAKPRRVVLAVGVFVLVSALVVAVADYLLAPDAESRPGPVADTAAEICVSGQTVKPHCGIALRVALREWLRGVQASVPADTAAADGHGQAQRVKVYFVAAAGGGVRAAHWTASVLDQMARKQGVLGRTFAVSGVSGGSVGAAAFTACERDASTGGPDRRTCLERFAATDLASPLLGAWTFEDVVAGVLPGAWCKTPACGFLSRGLWFEARLMHGVPAMATTAMRAPVAASSPHRPYLFLNSTWVESGQRAIASPIAIDASFPGARDTIGILGADLSLATAAHNSARFPLVNAIGLVRTNRALCPDAPRLPGALDTMNCGRIVDGGYFDNSGSHTVVDILRALQDVLDEPAGSVVDKDWETVRVWATRHLAPTVVFVRNGIAVTDPDCARPPDALLLSPGPQPSAHDVGCVPNKPRAFEPARLEFRNPNNVYGDVLGVVTTAVNVTGLGANGQRAEQLLIDEVARLRGWMRREARRVCKEAQAAAGHDAACADERPDEATLSPPPPCRSSCATVSSGDGWISIDHVNDGVLYPLGWYLSPKARDSMLRQVRYANLSAVD